MGNNIKAEGKQETITFHVYRKDGSPNTDIKRYFLDRRQVTAMDAIAESIVLDDKTKWKLILERAVAEALKGQDSVYCIVSFQIRQSGNYAIARLYDQTKDRKAIKNV